MVAIAAGNDHACALTTDGGVKCWGKNGWGQLGDGTTTQRLTPTPVSGLSSGVAEITAGSTQTCAIITGGAVKCWGGNANGQLGDGTTTQRLTPTAVIGLASGVTAIAAGANHTCALTTGGGVLCWGYNGTFQLGDGTWTPRLTPTAVSGLLSDGAGITAGDQHTCALTTDGEIKCWGDNGRGQLGDGTSMQRPTPTSVYGFGVSVNVTAIDPTHGSALGGTAVTISGARFS